jgi:hypothetical protein
VDGLVVAPLGSSVVWAKLCQEPVGASQEGSHRREKLGDLHRSRIAVDYAAASASHTQAKFDLDVVKATFHMIAHHMGWVL